MDKMDITQHSETELSLLVYNDEYLYRARFRRDFLSMIGELFIFTQEQMIDLMSTLDEDRESC